jgi:antitoxin component YwqK of YwqJK toxin-antitoxin module
MVFMAQRELLLSKFFFTLAIALLSACAPPQKAQWVEWGDEFVSSSKGVTYYRGERFTGTQYQLYPSGDTVSVVAFENGLRNGMSREWFDGGRHKSIRFYHNGKMEGEHLGWYANGQRRFVYHFSNDVFHGSVKEWAMNGNPYREFNYVDGQERGRQKMWEADGRLKANYEVRNGRKYGLAGSKNCSSIKS